MQESEALCLYVCMWHCGLLWTNQKLTHDLSFWIFKKNSTILLTLLILKKKEYNFYTNLKIALFVSKLAGCAKYVRSSKAEECVTGWCNRRSSSSSLGLLCVARASDETNCQPKICAKILLISGKFLNIYLSISVSITKYLVWDEKKSVSPFVITFWLFMD